MRYCRKTYDMYVPDPSIESISTSSSLPIPSFLDIVLTIILAVIHNQRLLMPSMSLVCLSVLSEPHSLPIIVPHPS